MWFSKKSVLKPQTDHELSLNWAVWSRTFLCLGGLPLNHGLLAISSNSWVFCSRTLSCLGGRRIDWCCFFDFVRSNLLALLEALCARIFFFQDSWISGFPDISFSFFSFSLCVCKAFVSKKSFSSARLNQAPVPGCRHSSCVLIIHVCLRVCASVCACENV